MLGFHTNGTPVGRLLAHSYFWPGYQAEQGIFNFLPQWLKDNVTLNGWPNRVTEFGWHPKCFDPPCNANLDTTTTSCDGARTGISSWGDYNDFVRISGQMGGYAVWLLSDQNSPQQYAKWEAVRPDCSARTWITSLINLYNQP